MTASSILAGLLLFGCSEQAERNEDEIDENDIVWIDKDDPDMSKAIRTARDSLDEFLELHAAPEPGMSDFKIKVRIEDDYGSEHFWITPFEADQRGFIGTLANEPRAIRSVAHGQRIEFDRDMISDWGYIQNGKQIGSFTICVLFDSMPASEVDYYRKEHGFDC